VGGRERKELSGPVRILRTGRDNHSFRSGGYLCPLRQRMRGFHDRLRQMSLSLFVLFACSSVSMTSLIIRSMYLVDRMLVSWRWMRWPTLMLCSATADTSGAPDECHLDPGFIGNAILPILDLEHNLRA
jgi:hypothetical protein